MLAWFGVFGVSAYVGTWAVLGATRSGYDPTEQAISELFAFGAPPHAARTLTAVLVLTGLALVPFAWMLHRRLPGASATGAGVGAGLLAYSGVMTAAVAFFPCTDACPGYGTTLTDSMHVITAGSGYVALVLAPLAFAWRTRTDVPRFATVSAALGGIATLGFVIRTAGIVVAEGGLQQRFFNTTADVWIVFAAATCMQHLPGCSVSRRSGRSRGSG